MSDGNNFCAERLKNSSFEETKKKMKELHRLKIKTKSDATKKTKKFIQDKSENNVDKEL
jgi:hypothetical protein